MTVAKVTNQPRGPKTTHRLELPDELHAIAAERAAELNVTLSYFLSVCVARQLDYDYDFPETIEGHPRKTAA